MQAALLNSPMLLKTAAYRTFEEFQVQERIVSARTIPFNLKDFRSERAILDLGACQVALTLSFPRFFEGEARFSGQGIVVQAPSRFSARVNGTMADPRGIAMLRGLVSYSSVETEPGRFATLEFADEMALRGWPDQKDGFQPFLSSAVAVDGLRAVVGALFRKASESPQDLATADARAAACESLLAALDNLVFDADLSSVRAPRAFERYQKIAKSVDAVLEAAAHEPIYSAALASKLGTNVRTLHSAILTTRGMSLHRYVKLHRLWTVRTALLAAHPLEPIKQVVLSHGFWHLGEFARMYRAAFGELPSETAQRQRRG